MTPERALVLRPEHLPLLVYSVLREPSSEDLDAFVGELSNRTLSAPRNAVVIDCTPTRTFPRSIGGRLNRWAARQDKARFHTWVATATVVPAWLDRLALWFLPRTFEAVPMRAFANLDEACAWARALYDAAPT